MKKLEWQEVMANFLSNVFHMLPDKAITLRMEQDRETPRISEGDHVRFSRKELDVKHLEQRDLLTCLRRLVYPFS